MPGEHCLRCAMCLLWAADLGLLLSWWMSTTQDPRKTWLANGNLLTVWWKMPSLRLRLQHPLAFPLWLSHACLSASESGGTNMQLLALLWYFLNILFSEHSRLWVRAFPGKPFFLSLWKSHSLGCYLMFAPSDCPQDIQA